MSNPYTTFQTTENERRGGAQKEKNCTKRGGIEIPPAGRSFRPILEHLPQHIRQNPTVVIVSDFFRCIRAGHDLKRLRLAPVVARLHPKVGAWREVTDALYGEGFMAAKPERLRAFARFEFQWQNTHAYEIAAVNPLIAFRNYRTHSQQKRPLRCPIA